MSHSYEIIPLLPKFARLSLEIEIYIYVCINFPVGRLLLIFSHHGCRGTVSSDVKFLCFITLFPLDSWVVRFVIFLPVTRSFIIRVSHLLPSTHTTCPYNFNILFPILSKTLCFTPLFYREHVCNETIIRPFVTSGAKS